MSVNGNISAGGDIRGTVSGPAPIRGSTGGVKVLHTDSYAIAVANGFVGTVDEWLESLKGPKGDTGISPVVSVEDIDGGHRVTITDKDGEKTFDVMDGEDGAVTEEQIASAVEDYMAEHPVEVTDIVKTVNGIAPDANGNVEIPVSGGNADLTGYAKEQWVQQNYQPKGEYLTEVPDDYAKTEDIPTKPEDIGAQPSGNYALKSEIPSVPVQSVNGKTGAVQLSAADVKARSDNWMPTAQEVGALPNTYTPPNQTAEQVGADPKGTAQIAVGKHNVDTDSHNDIRLELKELSDRLTAFFDSDDTTLDELSEIVAYITNNKVLIDSITTSKVSVADIVNNLTTNVANKPLSAAQGVVLKGLIDAVGNSLSNYQPKGDYALRSELPTVPTKVSQLENDKGYLTKHQDISGKLDADKLPEAVNAALAQAKDSGEFDGDPGVPGVTPHIGSNGNWYIGSADTGVKAQGKDGTNGTSVTVKSVSESTADGGSNVVTFSDGKTLNVKNGGKGSKGDPGTTPQKGIDYDDGKSAYEYAQDGGYTGTAAEFAKKLAGEYTLNPLYGKKVSFIGDSICAGNSASGTLGGYGKIIADRNNMVYENLAQGGSTITAETYSSTTGSAKGWISRMVDSMSADADYAIIEGGVNDAWQWLDHGTIEIGEISAGYDAELDDTTYYGAFESMLKKLITKFKGKKIGYIAIPKTMSMFDSSQNAPNFYHIALECCVKWGVSVCDLNTITPPTQFWGAEYLVDGTHPTYDGYLSYYCDPIEAWMKTLTTSGTAPASGSSVEGHNKDTNAHSDIRTLITALQNGKLNSEGVSFRRARLPLADGTILEIDVLTALDGTIVIPFVNQIPLSVDSDKTSVFGEDYNGDGAKDGYLKGYRLSSTGSTKTSNSPGSFVTGFISVKPGDTIHYSGFPFFRSNPSNASDGAGNYLIAYDSNLNMLGAICGNSIYYGAWTDNASLQPVTDFEIESDKTWTMSGKITLNSTQAIAYIRMSCFSGVASEPVAGGADAIITVNEEIG